MLNDECRNKVFSDQFVSNTVVSRWLFVSLVRLTALDTLIRDWGFKNTDGWMPQRTAWEVNVIIHISLSTSRIFWQSGREALDELKIAARNKEACVQH